MTCRIAIDLEMHADGKTTGNIIQLGWCIFSTKTEEILETGGDYIITNEPLSPYIQFLTGITEEDIQTRGVSLPVAYNRMVEVFKSYAGDKYYQIAEWGSGDTSFLAKSLNKEYLEEFGRSTLNVKAVYQMFRLGNKLGGSGGLKTALHRLGGTWTPYYDQLPNGNIKQRNAHDARCDALNTVRVYLALQKRFKGVDNEASRVS
jgi:DNA polymerase III epsilon subunit-like protein